MLPHVPLAQLNAAPDAARKFRLMEAVRLRLRERRYSRRTERAYVHWIRRYILFNERRHPRDLGGDDLRRFLSFLAVEGHVAASTQNQALAALTFLYDAVLRQPLKRIDGLAPARRSRYVPVVLSENEIRRVLEGLGQAERLAALLMYGSGLRLLECLRLRIKDIDIDRREVVVRDGKGGKDRRAPLAEACLAPLRVAVKARWERFNRDRAGHVRTTEIPAALLKKYPGADADWRWQYLFAARRTFVDAERQVRGIICTRP
jgi:site-specific recombinase XerD